MQVGQLLLHNPLSVSEKHSSLDLDFVDSVGWAKFPELQDTLDGWSDGLGAETVTHRHTETKDWHCSRVNRVNVIPGFFSGAGHLRLSWPWKSWLLVHSHSDRASAVCFQLFPLVLETEVAYTYTISHGS